MKVTKVTPSSLVEVYDVDLPPTATDAEVLAATEALAPLESTRQAAGAAFISWHELGTLDEVAEELAATKAAYERATEQAKAAIAGEAADWVSERELARKLGVDRITIRRWRGK